jgi:thiosulfate/3-mercaptopyruvate sulfurtransferase
LPASSHSPRHSPQETPPPAAAATRALQFEFLSAARAAPLVADGLLQCVDARPVAKYLAGHIPGAVSIRDEQVRTARGALPATIMEAHELAQFFAALGVQQSVRVMVYADGDDPLSASLVAYALVKAGHLRVSILDGGFASWQGAEPASQDFPTLTPAAWSEVPAATAATLDDVRTAMRTEETALVDARPNRFFRGETRGWKRNGHIPGATSFDWHQLVHADNEALVRPAKEISAQLAAAGLDAADDTIVYCGTGREATLLYLYLKGVARWPRVRLYEGSWTEYQSDAALPVARGAGSLVRIVGDGEITLSGQPDAEALAMLAERGVQTIINCRSMGEVRSSELNERAIATALGMKYVEIPLGGSDGYSPEDVEQLAKTMAAHPEPGRVHLHCAGGPRAATLWAAYLVKHRGVLPAQAMERIRKTGIMRETGFERLLDQTLLPQPVATPGH